MKNPRGQAAAGGFAWGLAPPYGSGCGLGDRLRR
jgi:hypothetical protein